MINISRIRHETPGCKDQIHFNNAGAALISDRTLKVQQDYLNTEAGRGGYEAADEYRHTIDRFYDNAALLLNAEPGEIAFTESATVAWLRAFWSIDFRSGDEIICDSTTYASNYIAFLNAQRRIGLKVIVVDRTREGDFDLNALKSSLTRHTRLLSITHMPTNNGLVNPAEEIGQIAAENNILYQLDACQSAGQYPLNVRAIRCDFLSATGRKYLRGSRGTGFLFVNASRLGKLHPLSLDLHSATWVSETTFKSRDDARRFETWEHNVAAKLGLSAAIEQANELGIRHIWERVTELAGYLRALLSATDAVTVADTGSVLSGIVTMYSSKVPADRLQQQLRQQGINTWVSVKSGTLIDMKNRGLDAVLRVSVHYYNTKEEIRTFVRSIKQLVNVDF